MCIKNSPEGEGRGRVAEGRARVRSLLSGQNKTMALSNYIGIQAFTTIYIVEIDEILIFGTRF